MFKTKDAMTTAVITAQPDMPIYDAIRLLANRNITGLPVVDEDLNLIGMLSEKDVLMLLYEKEDAAEKTVSDYMSTDVVSLDIESNLIDLCDCLTQNVFRRVPITHDGKLYGNSSRSDVIKAILRIKHQAL